MTLVLDQKIDPKAKEDILDLHENILKFKKGEWDNEKFRSYRLARGVYGQRQDGVNMVRIKLPFGKVTPEQLIRIADLSDEYASGVLHATTRQDIQIHYVKLSNTPQLWAKLEEKGITLREACGNTIRNLTASYMAGIDPEEPFDVSPYAQAMFQYFLRNPICQELGRKFKIAFSSSDRDLAFTYIHDLGFIPKIRTERREQTRGFKIVLAGGLGAQPFLAHPIFEFLEEDQIIPFTEAVIRVFDRYGERVKRHKARLKYLVQEVGLDAFMELVAGERKALRYSSFRIGHKDFPQTEPPVFTSIQPVVASDPDKYSKWQSSNVFQQKQDGYYGVKVKLPLGNLKSDLARSFAQIVEKYAALDIRITVNQGLLVKYVRQEYLEALFEELNALGLAEPGFDSVLDITACPGTDTCNLGIASSVGLAQELERVLKEEYSDLIADTQLKIKISGCMNACGHHSIANMGFHGMSLKVGEWVLPAMQVLLGGGTLGNGEGALAEKVIKLASKKVPDALRLLLNDYQTSAQEGEYFNDYFQKQGKNYFYLLLKPLSAIEEVTQDFLLDWGENEQYKTMIGVGECAGALVDMVALVLDETREKYEKAQKSAQEKDWVNAIYYAYSVFINSAKALLLTKELPCNTQYSVLNNMEKQKALQEGYVEGTFKNQVLQINKNLPSEGFALRYLEEAKCFFEEVLIQRKAQV